MQWLLLIIIVLQPIFDALTNWLLLAHIINVVAYARALFLLVFGALVLLQGKFKRSHIAVSVLWALYVLSRYFLGELLLKGAGMEETENIFRTMIFPIYTLWMIWFLNEDMENGLKTIKKGLLISAVLMMVLSLLSFVTDTYTRTYSYKITELTPAVKIGFSAWAYSANAQSIVLAVLFALLAAPVIRLNRIGVLCVYLASFWLTMYFHGTRTAYYAMLLIPAAVLALLLLQRLLDKTKKVRLYVLAAFGIFLVLTVAMKPTSILTVVDKSRQEIKNIASQIGNPTPAPDVSAPVATETVQPQGTATPEPAPTPAPTTQAVAPAPTAALQAPAGDARWDAEFRDPVSMLYFNQMQRDALYRLRSWSSYDKERLDSAAYGYVKQRMALPSEKLVDVRLNQTSYVMAFMRNADVLRLFTGFGKSWFTNVIWSVESDYPALYGYFGLTGCLVFFGTIAYVLYLILRKINFKVIASAFSIEIGMAALSFALMLFLAKFSGRVFQQASVSFYLALSLALLYGEVAKTGRRKAEEEAVAEPMDEGEA